MRAKSKLALGIIGLGSAGRTQYGAMSFVRRFKLVAIAEPALTRIRREKIRVPIHDDWRRLLDDKSIDAVSICLPHHMHASVTVAALQAGKHVLLEKPIARTVAEARRIIQTARSNKRVLMIEMTHRFYPPVVAGRELVRSGRIGRVYAAEDKIIEPMNGRPVRRWLFQHRFAGGGVALTNGFHMLDRLAWVTGQPLRLLEGRAGWSHKLGDVEDTAAMQLCFENGAPVIFLASWPKNRGRMDDELTIYGTRGILRIWAWRGWRFEDSRGRAEEWLSYQRSEVPGYVGMAGALNEFASAIIEGRQAIPSAQDVLPTQEIIEKFYRRTGKTK